MVVSEPDPEIEKLEKEMNWKDIERFRRQIPFELSHTELRLAFNWEQKKVEGKASLKLRPKRTFPDTLWLDAKYLTIRSVRVKSDSLYNEFK